MSLLPFSQQSMCVQVSLDEDNEFPLLHLLMGRYDGLCEVICNLVIKQDLLGNNGRFEHITLRRLNESDTHILHHFGFFEKAAAFLFNRYPFNIFSSTTNELSDHNAALFRQKFEKLAVGSYVKFFTFHKIATGYSPRSHSLLIKKTGQYTYSFFDPNHGEFSELSIDGLQGAVNYTAREWHATHIAFISGDRYVASLTQNQGHTSVFSAIKNAVKSFFKKLAALFCCGDDRGPPSPPPPPPTDASALLSAIRVAGNGAVNRIYLSRQVEVSVSENLWGRVSKEKAYFDRPKTAHQQPKIDPKEDRRQMMSYH